MPKAATKESVFLRRQDIERLYSISRSFIYSQIEIGQFPSPVKISSRCARWRRDDVERWATEQTPEAGA